MFPREFRVLRLVLGKSLVDTGCMATKKSEYAGVC